MANFRPIVIVSDGTKKELPNADTLLVSSLLFNGTTGDLSSPINGNVWYNSSTNKFRCKEDGVVKDLVGAGGSGGISLQTAVALAVAL